MSFQTPGGPAAKRRRIEAANATLRKPFRSPLIARKEDNQASPGANCSPSAEGTTPSTPAPARGHRPTAASPLTTSPLAANTPSLKRSANAASSKSKLSKDPAKPRPRPILRQSGSGIRFEANKTSASAGDDDDALLSAILTSQKQLSTHLRAAQAQLDLIRQARRIEQASSSSSSSAKRRPGGKEDGDGEESVAVADAGLEEMISRWKAASRLAAEELFGMVRDRVEGMGGVRAWRARQREVLDGDRGGFGDEKEVNGEGNGEQDDEGEGGGGSQREKDGEDEEEKEAEDTEFTMLMMLKSLNIDPNVLGYDPVEDKWRD